MRIRRSLLRDAGLLALAAATVAAAGFVLTRSEPEVLAPAPQDDRVRALVLGGDLLLATSGQGLGERLGSELGWNVTVDAVAGTGFITGPPGQLYAERVEEALAESDMDVVVLVGSSAAAEEANGLLFGGNAQRAAGAVRRLEPEAALVIVGPLGIQPDAAAAQREVLTAVSARFGAYFVDPVGGRYVIGQPGLVTPTGQLTAAGTRQVAQRLATDLRRVLPATLVDK